MLDMQVSWTLTLQTAQLNTILRGLRGCLRPEELEEAKELANSIAADRVSVTKSKMAGISKLEQNLEEGGRK